MKLLFDENLSRKLVGLLASEYPDSTHPDILGVRGATDAEMWALARDADLTIVSKDNDFRQRAFLYGPPPQVVWLSIGNAGTAVIAQLLGSNVARLEAFAADPDQALLIVVPG